MNYSTPVTGNKTGCPTCGEVFSTENNFDRHRKGDHGVDRHCVDPSTVGLNKVKLAEGYIWKMPPRDIYT